MILETRPKTIPQTSAPQAWRNRWRSLEGGGCDVCGASAKAGEAYFECRCTPAFPSRTTCEAAAMEDVVRQIARWGRMTDEWLGAFRQG